MIWDELKEIGQSVIGTFYCLMTSALILAAIIGLAKLFGM